MEFVPGIVPLTGISVLSEVVASAVTVSSAGVEEDEVLSAEAVELVEDETSVDAVSSAGVEEDEAAPTVVSVLLEVVASTVTVSSAGVEEDEVLSVEAV